MGKFMEKQMSNNVKLLSTDAVIRVLKKYIREEDEPLLYAPPYQSKIGTAGSMGGYL